MARELAKNPTVLVVNDTLFAHGGVLKRHGEISWAWMAFAAYIALQTIRLHG